MTSIEELDRRLTAVEEKADMEAELRASQDRDLASLTVKVNKMMDSIQALAVTSSEHNRKLDALGERFDRLESRFDGLDTRIDRLDTRLNGLDTRIDGLESRFDGLDTRIDGMDTRLNGMDARFGAGLTTITGMLTTLIERQERHN